jgi:hypothetical protein
MLPMSPPDTKSTCTLAPQHWTHTTSPSAGAAREWATLAHKWFGIELGPDSQQSRAALRIIRTPESHGAWGSREPEQVGGTEGTS